MRSAAWGSRGSEGSLSLPPFSCSFLSFPFFFLRFVGRAEAIFCISLGTKDKDEVEVEAEVLVLVIECWLGILSLFLFLSLFCSPSSSSFSSFSPVSEDRGKLLCARAAGRGSSAVTGYTKYVQIHVEASLEWIY